jgi:hypothetical protein
MFRTSAVSLRGKIPRKLSMSLSRKILKPLMIKIKVNFPLSDKLSFSHTKKRQSL